MQIAEKDFRDFIAKLGLIILSSTVSNAKNITFPCNLLRLPQLYAHQASGGIANLNKHCRVRVYTISRDGESEVKEEEWDTLIDNKKSLADTKETTEGQEMEMAKTIDGTFWAGGVEMPLSMDTRVGHGLRSGDNRDIVIDVREFRTTLPSQLHRAGFRLAPHQVYVGDYVLSDQVAVEKKSKPDLVGSLNNGRLFQQVVSMFKYYKRPVLLIQLGDRERLSLHSPGSEMKRDNVITKLSVLLMHFPKLRVIWAHGAEHAAEVRASESRTLVPMTV